MCSDGPLLPDVTLSPATVTAGTRTRQVRVPAALLRGKPQGYQTVNRTFGLRPLPSRPRFCLRSGCEHRHRRTWLRLRRCLPGRGSLLAALFRRCETYRAPVFVAIGQWPRIAPVADRAGSVDSNLCSGSVRRSGPGRHRHLQASPLPIRVVLQRSTPSAVEWPTSRPAVLGHATIADWQ